MLAGLCATAHAAMTHGFRATIEPDSQTYLEFDWSSAATALSQLRTCGYPLFLRFVTTLSSHPAAIPAAHWLAWLLAAGVLYRGLAAAGYRRFVAAWAAGSILFGHAALTFTPVVLADSLASTLSVAAVGFFLATLSCTCRRYNWIGLTATTFLAYLVRPAYLFLIPLWPVLWGLLGSTLFRDAMTQRTRWMRGMRYVAAGVVPFIGFCALRLVVVGHFGLVSFGGYNLIGVVGQFPSAHSIADLPTDLQPLASELVRRRDALPNAELPADYLAMERMFNLTVWQAAVPAAHEEAAGDPVVVNARLSRLSRSLLSLHRNQYVLWLMWNAKHAVKQTVLLMSTDRGVRFLIVAFLLLHAVALWRGPARTAADDEAGRCQQHLETQLLFWVAVGFAAAKTLLVILVEPAIGRYMMAATVLLPAALAVVVARSAANISPSLADSEGDNQSGECQVSLRPNQPVTRS
jgi:hypothetical protein